MSNTNDLLNLIKRASIEAIEASKPVNVCFGTVINISPLQIQINQKLILGKNQLILTRNVTNYTISINLTGNTNNTSLSINETVENTNLSIDLTHNHSLNGNFNITIKSALKKNEKVILIRMQDGQKYIILDRIGG